jgi:outer membrane autotransporter protein
VDGGTGSDIITLDGATIADLINGGDDADTIDLLSGSAAHVFGGAGNDTITLDGATISGTINGDTGDDLITINSGSYGTIYGHGDSDTITINGGTVASIQGDSLGFSLLLSPVGQDIFNLSGGTVTGDVFGLQLGDTITLDGTTVQGNIYGGIDPVNAGFFLGIYDNSGANTFILTSGTVAGGVFGENGGDTFTLNGATITGVLDGSAGNDSFTLTSGAVGSVQGGAGSDTATMNGFDLAGITGALDGGDDTSTGDGFIDTLTVSTSGTISGAQLLNWEVINLTAGQALQLTGAGLTTSAESGYGFSIASGSALSFGGDFALTGNLANAGALNLSGTAATAGDVVTVIGNLGGGGTLVLDADFDSMSSDRLVVEGTISGNHAITLNNLTQASAGGPTGSGAGAGMVLVDNSAGPGVAEGQFALSSGPIIAGVYRYNLSAESDGILYLQSVMLGEAAAYGILGEVMRDAFPTLRDRMGQRTYALDGSRVGRDVWASVSSDRRKVRPDESNPLNGGDWDENRREITLGVDVARFDFGGGEVVGSLGLHMVSSDATTFGTDLTTGDGTVSNQGLGLGGALTWFGANDLYIDVQGRLTRWDLSAGGADAAGRTDGKSWGLSVEAGQRLALGTSGALTPRVQLVWSEGRFDGFTDDLGTLVEAGTTESLILSSGLTYEHQLAGGTSLFADVAVYRDLAGESGVVTEGSTMLSGASASWGQLSVGASLPVSDKGAAYVAARGSKSLDAARDLSFGVEAGLRLTF